MNIAAPALAACAILALAAPASSQVPSGGAGSDAKGNAPLKAAHTVNDGAARRGRNSFTEGQAREHILKAGYQSVSALAKGTDGVWRGTAIRDGASVQVGLDFKGNVSAGAPSGSQAAVAPPTAPAESVASDTTAAKQRPHRHHTGRCAHPGANGAACSGVDRNRNGVSDKEDRALRAGARP